MKMLFPVLITISLLFKPLGFCKDPILVSECVSSIVSNFDCHSPSIAEVAPGILCAVWKGGPGPGLSNKDMSENVGIWLSRYEYGQWSQPVQIVSAPKSVCWNPVLCQHPSGSLYLFYRMGFNPRNVVALIKRSYDGGKTWSDEEMLPAGIFGPTKSKPFIDASGNMICGSSIECGEPKDSFKTTACWIEISNSSATNWKKYGPIEIPGRHFGAIEPSLIQDNSGNLKLFCRDRAAKIGLKGWIWSAESHNGGKTWGELKPTSLPNPDSGIEVTSLRDGSFIVIYNHSHRDRFPLTIALSQDGGDSWKPLLTLEERSGEMPSAILDSEGLLHIVYAWTPPNLSQRCIKHVVIDLSDLFKEEIPHT